MNKNILIIILIIIIGLLQIFFMPIFSVYSSVPNLILISVIVLILLDYEKEAFLLAGLDGLLLDFLSPLFFGFLTFFLILIIFILRFITRKIFPSINILIVAGITFISAVVLSILINLILKEKLSITFLLVNGIYNMAFAVVIFSIYNVSHRKLKLIKIKS